MLYPSEHKVVYGFIKGITLPQYFSLENLIAVSSSFSQFVNHMRDTKRECIRPFGGGSKRLYHY